MKNFKNSIIIIDILSALLSIIGFVISITLPLTGMGWLFWHNELMLNVVVPLQYSVTVLFSISILCTILLIAIKIKEPSFNNKAIATVRRAIVIFTVIVLIFAITVPCVAYSLEEYGTGNQFEIGQSIDSKYTKYFPLNSKFLKNSVGSPSFFYTNQSLFSTTIVNIQNFATVSTEDLSSAVGHPSMNIEYFCSDSAYISAVYSVQMYYNTFALAQAQQQERNGIKYRTIQTDGCFYLQIANENELYTARIFQPEYLGATEDEIIDASLSVYQEVTQG